MSCDPLDKIVEQKIKRETEPIWRALRDFQAFGHGMLDMMKVLGDQLIELNKTGSTGSKPPPCRPEEQPLAAEKPVEEPTEDEAA